MSLTYHPSGHVYRCACCGRNRYQAELATVPCDCGTDVCPGFVTLCVDVASCSASIRKENDDASGNSDPAGR